MTSIGWVLAQPAVFPWVALAVGLAVGSFLNVVIHRLPQMLEREWRAECAELAGAVAPAAEPLNLFFPRSRCPSCAKPITALQNVPILSWIFLQGKCSSCKVAISLKYPVVEALAGIGAAYAAWRFGATAAAFGAALFIWFTIALAVIDQETGLLPDNLTLPLVWLGLIFNLGNAFVPLSEAVIGAVAGYLSLWLVYWIFKLLTRREGMGFGDFKMNAAVGAFLGWKMLPLVILVSSVVGSIFGIGQMFAAKRGWEWNFKFHFGPYLAIAGIVAMFWGRQIVDWYLR